MIRIFLLALLVSAPAARAGTFERVKTAGVLRCASAERAGFAVADGAGRVSGPGVELCRALTVAVLGLAGQTAFRILGSDHDFANLAQADDVVFLSTDEVRAHGLASALVPGPVVFVAEFTAAVQPGVTTVANRTVCFMSGSPAHQALEAWAFRTGTPFIRSAFQEEGEMHDAFGARRCDAMAGERADLARPGVQTLPPFGLAPVFAATGTSDGAWAGLAFWALAAVVQSEPAPNPWRGDLVGTDLPGLRPGWLADVRSLPRSGVNALWPDGLLLPPGPR